MTGTSLSQNGTSVIVLVRLVLNAALGPGGEDTDYGDVDYTLSPSWYKVKGQSVIGSDCHVLTSKERKLGLFC